LVFIQLSGPQKYSRKNSRNKIGCWELYNKKQPEEGALIMKNDLRKLSTIFEAMADGVCIVNHDFTIEYMNSVMVENFCDGVGEKCYEILENRNEVCIRCEAGRVFKGETLRQ
jgi:hypothetical protein